MHKLKSFAITLSAILMTGCVSSTGEGSETANEICRQLGDALPTRSHKDTQQSQDEDQALYGTYSLTCPDFVHLIPE